jgi:hypothetical protein
MESIVKDAAPPRQMGDRQPRSTDVNEQQPVQRDIGGVYELPAPVFIDWRLIDMCTDELDAVNLCIDCSRQKDEWLAKKLDIDKGHWCRMRKRSAHFPTAKRLALMQLCGNWAPLQFEMLRGPSIQRLMDEFAPAQQPTHPAASRGLPREMRA